MPILYTIHNYYRGGYLFLVGIFCIGNRLLFYICIIIIGFWIFLGWDKAKPAKHYYASFGWVTRRSTLIIYIFGVIFHYGQKMREEYTCLHEY
jgi:energy-coupling factor transporter transmembrane protein EcfT